jgi:hypothetical protein
MWGVFLIPKTEATQLTAFTAYVLLVSNCNDLSGIAACVSRH